jgi:hypothetical protein
MAAMKTGAMPVTVEIVLPPRNVTATQTGMPVNGAMPVVIDTGQGKETMNPGRSQQFGDLSVQLVASIGETGPRPADLRPYAVNVIASRPGK